MEYTDLRNLIYENKPSRDYFFTLPRDVQLELSLNGGFIHTPDELHRRAREAEHSRRTELLSRYTCGDE